MSIDTNEKFVRLTRRVSQVEFPVGPGGQGYGPRAVRQPPAFAPSDVVAAIAYFKEHGCVRLVLGIPHRLDGVVHPHLVFTL
eukprot:SAG11_NODE_14618_length_605_cov_1.924901_2_plen_82_part_00